MISLSSQKQSNAWHHLHNPDVREVFFGGGARSGKSVLLCGHEIHEAATHPGTRGLICREDFTALQDSTMKTFFDEVLPMFGYRAGEHFTFNGSDKTISWKNGSETLFRHMKYQPSDPNYSRIGSTAFTRVSIDEGDELFERAFEMLRARTGFNEPPHGGKILTTGNPGDYWTKRRYVYNKDNQRISLRPDQRVVLSTVRDNPDPVARARYTELLESMTDDYDRERLLNGNWLAAPRTGMEFFPQFSSSKHAQGTTTYDPEAALHVTLDFNAAPYMTLLVAQIAKVEERWSVKFLKEYCLPHPLSTTKAACEALLRDLADGCYKGHTAGLFFYGDASGKSRTTMATEETRHNFDTVKNVLKDYTVNGSDRVLRSNPPHTKARDFMNDVFAGKMGIDIAFDRGMHNTIRDHISLKQGADGSILKEYERDRVTGDKYERYGHCAQAAYYLCISAFNSYFRQHAKMAA
mgnify:CR=1 FL=1